MTENQVIEFKSEAVEYAQWTYDQKYLYYKFSPNGRFIYKLTSETFLVVDTLNSISKAFSRRNAEGRFQIRDFAPMDADVGLLLYVQNQQMLLARLKFDFESSYFDLQDSIPIDENFRCYGGNVIISEDQKNAVVFLTRNIPGDVFHFFDLNQEQAIEWQRRIQTTDRMYVGFPYLVNNQVYFFRMAKQMEEIYFEAVKVVENASDSRVRSIFSESMSTLMRSNLMNQGKIPKFRGSWSDGRFYLSINLYPHFFIMVYSVKDSTWSQLKMPDSFKSQLREPQIHVNEDGVLFIHDERIAQKAVDRLVVSYRIPTKRCETLKNLSWFAANRFSGFNGRVLRLPQHFNLLPVFKDPVQ
ncbi:hypothetical protein M3Y98_01158100 [Aphelenchoides besseyi]|nr:hypothetical protein M3Y98_01158100 [Aphelenchoides besseyi]KAI6210846.1 hypothetical protein M3Y96_00371200 [Aphelenchoides besseyi]